MKLMAAPRFVDIDIINKCNLKCSYCGHFASAGDVDSDLSTDAWLEFFEELGRYAVMTVCLSGGETFLRKDLKELLLGIVKNRMRFSILSNGTLITEEIAAFVKATGRCNYVQVSVDGSGPLAHEVCRGDGNFRRTMNGLMILQKHGVPVAVRVTIHRHNVHDLEGIAKLLLEDIGLPSFSTNAASYMGLCKQNTRQVQLTVEERTLAMETLLKLSKKYNGRIAANAGPLAEARMWTEMERARRKGQRSLPGGGYLRSCGGVFSNIAVRADGVIVPCIQMSHMELGRVGREDLKDLWQNHETLHSLRQRQDIHLGDFEFCAGCVYIPYCSGNCPALAYTILGKENHPSPDACLRRFLAEGGRLPIEESEP